MRSVYVFAEQPVYKGGGPSFAEGLGGERVGRDLADPAVARAVQANAATSAIHQFAEKDALRKLGTNYFGQGEAGEKALEIGRIEARLDGEAQTIVV